MAEQAIINTSTLTSIGDAIRTKTGKTDTFLPSDMPTAILAIETGSDVSGVTAAASDVRSGKKFVDSSGAVVTGTVTARTASNVTSSNNVVTIPAGIYDSQVSKTVGTAKSAATYTPGTSDQTIPAGRYLTGAQTIKGDAKLVAENIVSGETIFGVIGWAPRVFAIDSSNMMYSNSGTKPHISLNVSKDIASVDALGIMVTRSTGSASGILRTSDNKLIWTDTDGTVSYSDVSFSGSMINLGITIASSFDSVMGFVAVEY